MTIRLDRSDGVVRITIDRPERRNALTPEAFDELRDALAEIARSTDDRAVLMTGAGTAFCAGADLSEGVPEEPPLRVMARINEAARALHHLPQPVVAAVEGPAYGAGMSIALACDLVVASATATFCQVFVKRGLAPDFGSSWLLPRTVGLHTAKRLVLLGETVDAEEGRRLGFVSEVVEPSRLQDTAETLVRRIADGPPIAMALAKRLLEASSGAGFDEALDAEAAAATITSGTQDVVEAFTAFAESRPPVFRGR